MEGLTRTWLLLVALTAATTTLAFFDGRVAAALLLVLAFLKARAILSGFLHLKRATGWIFVATVPLGIWLTVLFGLYAI
ncbi:cytochrome C oxidase subunit IV family protein [Aquamicrobium terrae]|uniref:Heme/copper-type cytochrome/quinol oxidase subunit 4 n=1 Tax=Aquamicrobium terrae TaxID=1324945 RepID=A0ABV2MY30_9HYPH